MRQGEAGGGSGRVSSAQPPRAYLLPRGGGTDGYTATAGDVPSRCGVCFLGAVIVPLAVPPPQAAPEPAVPAGREGRLVQLEPAARGAAGPPGRAVEARPAGRALCEGVRAPAGPRRTPVRWQPRAPPRLCGRRERCLGGVGWGCRRFPPRSLSQCDPASCPRGAAPK